MRSRQAVASSLAGLLVLPTAAWAQEPSAKPPLRASVDVDADALGEDAEIVENRVNVRLGAQLRKAEVLPRKSLSDGLIHVEVTPLPGAEGYHYEVYAEQNDATLEASVTSEDCAGCSEDALLDAVSTAVDACLPPLADAQAPLAVVAEPEPARPEPPPAAAQRDATKRVGVMGKVGVGLMAGGAASLVTGVLFIVQGRTLQTQPGKIEQGGLDFRTPGYAVAASGAVALITGGILFGVDRRRRTSAAVAQIPGGLALHVGGRF